MACDDLCACGAVTVLFVLATDPEGTLLDRTAICRDCTNNKDVRRALESLDLATGI